MALVNQSRVGLIAADSNLGLFCYDKRLRCELLSEYKWAQILRDTDIKIWRSLIEHLLNLFWNIFGKSMIALGGSRIKFKFNGIKYKLNKINFVHWPCSELIRELFYLVDAIIVIHWRGIVRCSGPFWGIIWHALWRGINVIFCTNQPSYSRVMLVELPVREHACARG